MKKYFLRRSSSEEEAPPAGEVLPRSHKSSRSRTTVEILLQRILLITILKQDDYDSLLITNPGDIKELNPPHNKPPY